MSGRADREFRERIVAEARGWLGTPYHHGQAVKQAGCDCLGLVVGVWRALYGSDPETPPPYSPDWAEADRRETLLEAASRHLRTVDERDLRPGDVVVFRWRPFLPAKHCGILVGSDRIVHAYQSAGRVCEGGIAHWRGRIAGTFAFPIDLRSRAAPPPDGGWPSAGAPEKSGGLRSQPRPSAGEHKPGDARKRGRTAVSEDDK